MYWAKQNIHLLADMPVARAAGLANAAADVPLGTDPLADRSPRHRAANLHHSADEFMAGRNAHLHAAAAPGVPFVNMAVRAADARMRHRNQRVAGANGRNGRLAMQP